MWGVQGDSRRGYEECQYKGYITKVTVWREEQWLWRGLWIVDESGVDEARLCGPPSTKAQTERAAFA